MCDNRYETSLKVPRAGEARDISRKVIAKHYQPCLNKVVNEISETASEGHFVVKINSEEYCRQLAETIFYWDVDKCEEYYRMLMKNRRGYDRCYYIMAERCAAEGD